MIQYILVRFTISLSPNFLLCLGQRYCSRCMSNGIKCYCHIASVCLWLSPLFIKSNFPFFMSSNDSHDTSSESDTVCNTHFIVFGSSYFILHIGWRHYSRCTCSGIECHSQPTRVCCVDQSSEVASLKSNSFCNYRPIESECTSTADEYHTIEKTGKAIQ